MMARVQRLLDVMENTDGDVRRADAAERRTIDELRAMGQEVLQSWGANLAQKEAQMLQASGGVVRQEKKTPLVQYVWSNRSHRADLH